MSARDETISNADFGRLRSLIYAQSGINLNADKKTMLELRIKRRLRSLNLNSFGQYCDYLFGPHGQKEELVHLIDVVTTNKTDFFREPEHFEFLVQKAIPDLVARNQSGRPLLIWSAGCSTGEEPYTLAMMLNEYVAGRIPVFGSGCWRPISPPRCWRRPSGGLQQRSRAGRCRRTCGEGTSCAAAIRDSNVLRVVPELRRTGGISASELHGCRLRPRRKKPT